MFYTLLAFLFFIPAAQIQTETVSAGNSLQFAPGHLLVATAFALYKEQLHLPDSFLCDKSRDRDEDEDEYDYGDEESDLPPAGSPGNNYRQQKYAPSRPVNKKQTGNLNPLEPQPL